MAGAAAFGITRSIYSLRKAQLHKHAVPFCVPVSLVHLMNIDHAHSNVLLSASDKKSVVSGWHRGNFLFSCKCTSVESFFFFFLSKYITEHSKMNFTLEFTVKENMLIKNFLLFCFYKSNVCPLFFYFCFCFLMLGMGLRALSILHVSVPEFYLLCTI